MKKNKILVAEDTDFSRMVIEHILEELDIEYYFAENGQEAIDIFTLHNDFDLILMDIEMPVMNGKEVTTKIRTDFDSPRSDIYIVAMTVHDDENYMENLLTKGFDTIISKPFEMEVVLNLLKKAEKKKNIIKQKKIYKLNTLKKWGTNDDVFIKELIKVFIKTSIKYIKELKKYQQNKEWTNVAGIAHKMKSQITVMGANYIEMLSEIEKTSLSEERKDISKQIKEIEDKYEELIIQLNHDFLP